MKTKKKRQFEFLLKSLRPVAAVWMWFDTTTRKTTEVPYDRKEPFVLLGNHVYEFDVISLALPWKNSPSIVASEFLMTTKGLKTLLNRVARVIPKSKGAADVRTAKGLIRAVKKGFPVMIMPEGDSTYFGETGYVEESTAKLIKKLKIDVVVGKFSGGYLAKPRWSTGKRRKRYVELHYKISIKKEDIPNMTEDEIYSVIKKDLYNNDYEWQRNVMHPYGGKKLAEGIDNILYKCPECGELNSIYASKNEIECRACNTQGHIDKYGFIQGFKFDNLVDWDNYQREAIDEIRDAKFSSTARMVTVDTESQFRTKPQPVSIAYHDGSIFVKGKEVEEFKISEMHNPVLTMRRNLSFDYDGITVMFYVDRLAMSFLRACQSKY